MSEQLLNTISAMLQSKGYNSVKCEKCGRVQRVSHGHCLAKGWPQCHGYTMTLCDASGKTHEEGKVPAQEDVTCPQKPLAHKGEQR